MLVLSRKPSEAIIIGKDGETKVTILAVKGYQVKIGVDAPRDISVHREEVYSRIQDMLLTDISDEQVVRIKQAANDDSV